MRNRRLKQALASGSFLICTQLSYAAAFQFYEVGAPVNGTAGVGQAAIASDASTSYFNPAGMTQLPTSELMLGTQIILPYTNFSPNDSTTIPGNNGGSAGTLAPGLAGYYVYNFSPKLKFGVSFNSPYGGSLQYNDHWVGRYAVQQITFYALDLNPSVAYQINSMWSVGAGFTIEYANINQTVAIPISATTDGQADLKVDNTSPGFNVGALFSPTSSTKIGATYRSQIIHHFNGDIDFLNIGVVPSATTKMVMPTNVIASLSQKINNKWTLLGELGWANWSSMKDTVVEVDGFSAVNPQNWHDTYRVGLGGQFQAFPTLMVQAGASFDSSPTSSSNRTPELPMDRQIRVGAGLDYLIAKAVNFAVSYEYINLGNASINNTSSTGTFAGSYSRNFANVFQASLNVAC